MTTRARIRPGDGDPRHGTGNGYQNLGCRCEACKTAGRDYFRAFAAQYPHGAPARYLAGCRCDQCRTGNNVAVRLRRHGHPVSTVVPVAPAVEAVS